MMKRIKKLLFAAVATLLGLLVCLLVLEGIVRAFGWAPALTNYRDFYVTDPHLPYRPKPLHVSKGRTTTQEYDYEYVHNSIGLRDVEHNIAKPDGVFRILGLGDSFTYGIGVPFEKTYLFRLEQELNLRPGNHPVVEIIKAGVPRYFPEAERILLERYLKGYSPDLILVGFILNDVTDTFYGIDAVIVDKSGYLLTLEAYTLGYLGKQLYLKSHLGRIFLRRYVNKRFREKYHADWRAMHTSDGVHEKDWLKVADEYQKIVTLAHNIGARVVFIHIPEPGPWEEFRAYPGRRLKAIALQLGAGFVDAFPGMKAASQFTQTHYPSDGHCTAAGHAVIANAVYQYLQENQFVP